jgi:hypothetical protein
VAGNTGAALFTLSKSLAAEVQFQNGDLFLSAGCGGMIDKVWIRARLAFYHLL